MLVAQEFHMCYIFSIYTFVDAWMNQLLKKENTGSLGTGSNRIELNRISHRYCCAAAVAAYKILIFIVY